MATELAVQSERAFQKQPHVFLNHKRTGATKSRAVGKGGRRWYKDVGLGFRTPKNAIQGKYIGTNAPARRDGEVRMDVLEDALGIEEPVLDTAGRG